MAILDIGGQRVEIDDGFLSMSPEEQNATVEEIERSLNLPAPTPAAQPVAETPIAQPQRTGGILGMLDQPSRMPNSIADTQAFQPDTAPLDFGQFFKAHPADMTGIQTPTPEQAMADEAALRNSIRVSQNPDIGSDYKLQELAKAPTDLLGTPQDAMTMVANGNLWGLDKLAQGAGWLTGNDLGVDYRVPTDLPGSSDWLNTKKEQGIDSLASLLASMTGVEPLREDETLAIAPEDVSAQDRMIGAGTRFGAGALLGGGLSAGSQPITSGLKSWLPNAAPYLANPSKALMGDTMAGAGSGVVQQAYQEYAPENVKEFLGPIGDVMAAIVGGFGGGTFNAAGHSVVDGVRNMVKDSDTFGSRFTNKSTPINPDTGKQFRPSEMEMAARIAQSMPSDRNAMAKSFNQSRADFDFADPNQQPTLGMRSDDVGMSIAENSARSKDPERFKNQDNRREALATNKIASVAPADADGLDFRNKAVDLYRGEMSAADQKVQQARAALDTGGEDITKQNLELDEARNRQNLSSAALDSEYRKQLDAETAKKNQLYAAVPDDVEIDSRPVYEAMMAIEDSVPRAARVGTDYANASKRIRDLVAPDETGQFTPLTYGDLKILKTDVGAMRKEAVAAGRDVSQLDKVNQLLSEQIDALNPEAAKNYAENFAPRFKTGKIGEITAQTKRAVKTGDESSATRPSDFAGKVLTKPEDAAALQRAIDVNGNPVTAENATQWMLGDLAKSGVTNAKGDLRYDKVKQWAAKNKDIIDQFPAVRARIDAEVKRAEQGGRFSKRLADDVKKAETEFANTRDTLEHSALQSAIGKNPVNAVDDIMRHGDPEAQMADMVNRLKASGDDRALAGLKAATRDWIKRKVATSAHLVGQDGTRKTSRANLDEIFREHEKVLAKVYSPEEMNTLRQAHKLLDVAANLDVQARPGSDTAGKMKDQLTSFFSAGSETRKKNMRMFEVAAKLRYGMLKGGGITRTVGLMLDSMANLSTKPQAVENIIMEMMFNPDLAAHLMNKSVKEVGTPAWNAKLNNYLAIASGARDDKIEEGDDQ